MAKAKIFITRRIPEAGIKMLEEHHFNIKISPYDRVLSSNELLRSVRGMDAILSILTDEIDAKVMEAAGPKLKIIANYSVGYDNIDLEEAKRREIMVSNTPGVLTETVAEHSFALLLALARRVVEADKFTRDRKYRGWEPMLLLGTDVYEKTLGILGLGRIGLSLARIAIMGFSMNVLYNDAERNKDFESENKVEFVKKEELLRKSDFVSLHVPLLPKTKHLIGAKELRMMKKTAFLINTSRGQVINEKELVKALKNKEIRGAALDVFENEPRISAGLLKLRNVVLTPHIASASEETREKMAEMAAFNIITALKGKKPPNLVK